MAGTHDRMPVAGAHDQMPVAGAHDRMPVAGTHDQMPVAGTHDRMPVAGAHDRMPVAGTHEPTREPALPLTDEQTAAWTALAGMLTALPAALDAQLRRTAGMRLIDYQVLTALSSTPDRTARMTVLAEMAAVSQSRVSRVADRLEARGWLRRHPDGDDGRGTLAELTDAGWDAAARATPAHVAQLQRLVFGRLSDAHVRHLDLIARRVLDAVLPDHCLRVPAGSTW